MNSRKFLAGFMAISILAASCNKVTYKKTPGGMTYQLYPGKDTQHVNVGNIMKLSITTVIKSGGKDSVYFSTKGKLPVFLPVPGNAQPYDLSELWTKLKVGDSIVATQMMDSFIKKNPELIQRFKIGDRILNYVKVLAVYTSDSAANAENKKMQDDWLKGEIETVSKYLAGKNINAQKTPSGAFVEITNAGTGNLLDSGKYVSVKYTGTTFSGVKFDSNTDTAFHHTEPYSFTIGTASMIKGFDEAMKFLRVGGSARVYIPSLLGYGPNPGTPLIKPFDNLIFDISVTDVKDAPPVSKPLTNPGENPGVHGDKPAQN